VFDHRTFSAVSGDTEGGIERSGTPSFSLPSGEDDFRGLLSVNVPMKVWISFIGASAIEK